MATEPLFADSPAPRRRWSASRQEAVWFYITILPWVIGFVVFTAGPMLYSIYLSLTEWDLFSDPRFIGFANYTELLTADPIFWKVVGNTFYFAFLAVPLGMAFSLFIAYFLNKSLPGMRLFRTMYYLPALVPAVATSLVFRWLFAPDAGLINRAIGLFGIDGPSWLLDPNWVKPSLVIMALWGVGSGTVLLLAGMKGIASEFYEAASIDGANQWQQFFQITLPLLSPVIFFNLVTGLIGAFQTFTSVYILTGSGPGGMGGPNNASMMIVPYLYSFGFRFFRMGYASAIAWVLFAIIMVFTAMVLRSSNMWVFYETEVKKS